MEAAFSPSMAAINSLSSPNHTPTITKLTFLTTPTCLQFRTKNSGLFLAKSTAKPNANQENAANEENLLKNPTSTIQPNPTLNQSLSSSIPSFSRGLVFDIGQKDSWDSSEVGSPVVKRYLSDEEERWYMWYHGSSNDKESIGLAVSSNGIHWERGEFDAKLSNDVGLVMHCGDNWWAFDIQSVRPCEVVIMSSAKVRANSSVYWLYYTGFSSEKVEFSDSSLDFGLENPDRMRIEGENGKIFKSLPGLAMSQDGRHWARIEGEHHSGALFDVGGDGEWDSLFIASPRVVFHGNGDLRMYYHSYDVEKGNFAIGMARSRDGMKWLKLGKIVGGGGIGAFDELGVMNPHVVRNRKDGRYLMAYEGVAADGSRSIGVAISSDGLKGWKRIQENPVLTKSREEEDRWDSEGIGSPYLVQMDGNDDHEWRLYYRGIGKNGRTGIGMAVSQGNELQSFQRWTGFHF